MAAAEYYNPGGGSLRVPQHAPHPQQRPPYQSQQSLNSLPYPISDAPPPYSTYTDQPPRPNSQPPPQSRVHFQNNSYPQSPAPAPYQPQNGGYQYPSEKQGQRPPSQNIYRPQAAPSPYQSQRPQSQAGYPFPNGQAPAMQQPYGRQPRYDPPRSKDNYDGDSRSLSRSRSRSRDRRRHHHHHHHHHHGGSGRPPMEKKKQSGVSTFLGAGGGALIGDAIFPGLGTLGGAILGGVGGHEYGKQRRSYSNPSRARDARYGNEDEYGDVMYGRGRRY